VLNLVGRTAPERAKSVAIGLLAGLLVVSLFQLSGETAQATKDDRSRQAAIDIAQRFALALTTYDYAHPGVQASQISSVSSSTVRDRVLGSSVDVAAARASSLGGVTDTVVASVSGSRAKVVLETVQVVSGSYTQVGTKLSALLEVVADETTRGWQVTNYRWLRAPSDAP
jgi:hypothetical protein